MEKQAAEKQAAEKQAAHLRKIRKENKQILKQIQLRGQQV